MRPSSAMARTSPSDASRTSISSVGSSSWTPVSTAPRARRGGRPVRVGRVDDERADMLQRGRRSRSPRPVPARRTPAATRRGRSLRPAVPARPRRCRACTGVRGRPALGGKGEDDAEAARLAHEIVVDDLAARQFDPSARNRRYGVSIRYADERTRHGRIGARSSRRVPRPGAELGGPHSPGSGTIERLQIGRHYDTTYGTL